jgi:hypothetical protein
LKWAPDVDSRTSSDGGPHGSAVSQRPERWRMGVDRADDPAGQTRRASARGECARGAERDLLCAVDRLPVASAAEGFAAEEHGAPLFRPVGLGRHAGTHPPRALCRDARARGARGQPLDGDHRQPERQGGSKRGSTLDPQGFDAGKKVTGRKRHILVDTLGLLLASPSTRPICRIATVRETCCARRGDPFRSSNASLPTPDTRGQRWPRWSPRPACGACRSSSAAMPIASSSCPSDGSSSVLLPGSAATAAWPATSSVTPEPSRPSSASP